VITIPRFKLWLFSPIITFQAYILLAGARVEIKSGSGHCNQV